MSVNKQMYHQLLAAEEQQTPCILANVINTENSTSANIGDKAIITPDGNLSGWIGGGCCQSVVKKLAPKILQDNKAITIRVCPEHAFVSYMPCYPSHCASEGTVDIFLEPIANEQAILLYGQTPVAESIAKYSEDLAMSFAWQKSLPYPNEKLGGQFRVAIIATQGTGDIEAIQNALNYDPEHVLLVASNKKAKALIKRLQEMGASEQTIQKISARAGIDIGAISHSEIALSIMAKVVELKNRRIQQSLDTNIKPKKPAVSVTSCCSKA
ncbi:XdhC family protein [Agarilytica rhodophyticola]|uniref:XdhC family protein n=1 Tax=Agarilytica rhodophyticola TaxID=1737490 RepID=UPI000B34467D|nr:XdhC family protein [Agarilytica rhodophyticola]